MSHTKILATFLFGSFLLVDVHGMENNLKTRGLYNEGNSCWFNSSIQFLHASPSFRKLVSDINNCSKKKNASEENNSIAKHLMDLFEFLENGKNEHGTMDDFLKIDIWPPKGRKVKRRDLTKKGFVKSDVEKLNKWVYGKEYRKEDVSNFGKECNNFRGKIVEPLLERFPEFKGYFSKDEGGHTKVFIEALIKGLEREIVDNFIENYGEKIKGNKKIREEITKAIDDKDRKEKVNVYSIVYNIVESPRKKNEGLVEKLEINENEVTDSMRSIDLLFQKFDDNIYDFVLLNKYGPTKLAITEWVYGQEKYDIHFETKNDVCVKTIPGSSVSRVASKDIIIQEIENINSIGSLNYLKKKVPDKEKGITYYDLPGGYKFLLNNEDPNFSKISSVMLRYVTGSSAHTVSAVRYDKENFIFISDETVATQKINSWIDLHNTASVFISQSHPYKIHYACPERVLYDFGNENQ